MRYLLICSLLLFSLNVMAIDIPRASDENHLVRFYNCTVKMDEMMLVMFEIQNTNPEKSVLQGHVRNNFKDSPRLDLYLLMVDMVYAEGLTRKQKLDSMFYSCMNVDYEVTK